MKKIFNIFILLIVIEGLIFAQELDKKEENIIEYLEFREVDIKDVLRQLAKQYDLNIVFSQSVKGLITIQLHNVTIDQALDAIVTANGYVYTKKGNIYKVSTPEEAEKERKITEVFRLKNANAEKLKKSLKKMLSKDGDIEVDTRLNSLIITDTPSVMAKLKEIIPKLDEPTPQVLIEAKFIETTLEATEKLGIDWSTTVTASGSSRPITFPFKAKGDEIFSRGIFSTPSPSDSDFSNPTAFPYIEADNFTFGTLSFTEFRAILDFLMTKSNAKLLSSPRVVTLNNKEARIQIGETRYIRTGETYNTETKEREYTYEEKELGVILTVTPHVIPGGYIKLTLKPEVSSFKGYDANDYPIITTRNAETEVVIKDGQTIVIGGLVKNEKTVRYSKVPFLGNLPLLGWFFTHKEVDPNTKSNLLIFVTARIVKGDRKLLAYESNLINNFKRPFKLELKEVNLK